MSKWSVIELGVISIVLGFAVSLSRRDRGEPPGYVSINGMRLPVLGPYDAPLFDNFSFYRGLRYYDAAGVESESWV